MNQRDVRGQYSQISYSRSGGLWTWVVAVLSSILVLGLAVLFSALFLGLFLAIAVGVAVRAWMLRDDTRPSRPGVIDAEYTVIDPDDSRRRPPGS